MREIKFRGRNAADSQWIYGHYFHNGKFGVIRSGIVSRGIIDGTLGQYTGLLDKSGVEIYEGDIVLVPQDWDEFGSAAGETYEVYYSHGGFRFKPKYGQGRRGFGIEDDKTFKLIGNIHENPELLDKSTQEGAKE